MIDLLAFSDGKVLAVRPIERDDGDRMRELFARLTPASRYRRYLSSKPELTGGELARLTDIDHARHDALAAVDNDDGSFVAAARYVELPDQPGVAEVAIEVADPFQGLGIGTALANHLLARAYDARMHMLVATTLRENAPARALLRRLGFHAVTRAGREIVLERTLGPDLGSDSAKAAELEPAAIPELCAA